MLLGTLGASLLGNILEGKRINRAGKGRGRNRAGEGFVRVVMVVFPLKTKSIFNAASSFN